MGSIIMGVDPGTYVTGYGIINQVNAQFKPIDYGCIRPPVKSKLTEKHLIIFNAIEELITKFQPSILVVETQFVHKNVKSALTLGMARGIVMVAAKRKALYIFEYAPTRAKAAVTGNGRASKHQVKNMIRQILHLPKEPQEDAADALALAICHAHTAPFLHQKNEI
jgi:crossover junction endodeoxyribonuclease RuvC